MSIIPGIETAAPERTETSSGSSGSPKRLPALPSSAAMCSATSSSSPSGSSLAGGHVGAAGVGRDREAGRHRDAERGHLREPDRPCRRAARGRRRSPRRRRRRSASARGIFHNVVPYSPWRGHILAMGGGRSCSRIRGIDDLMLELAGVERPHVCFLGHRVGDNAGAHRRASTSAFAARDCEPSHLELFGVPGGSGGAVARQDVIYVGGGNTANMLAIWRVHGVDRALREAWERGAVARRLERRRELLVRGLRHRLVRPGAARARRRARPARGELLPALRRRAGAAADLHAARRATACFRAGLRGRRRRGLPLRGHRAARGRQPARRRARLPRHGRRRGAARRAAPVRRVAIVATASGCGKTTLGPRARAAARRAVRRARRARTTGPDWIESDGRGAARARSSRSSHGDGWVIDGGYRSKLGDLVLGNADVVVWLDLPIGSGCRACVRRTRQRILRREELWNGNRETSRNVFFSRDTR